MKMRLALRVLMVLASAAILPACGHLPRHHKPHLREEPRGPQIPPTAPPDASRSLAAD